MHETDFRTGVIKPLECFKEGWVSIKDSYWLLFAITIVGLLIGGLSLYILVGSMVCGIFSVYFKVFDNKEPQFEDLFAGFRFFRPSLIVVMVIVVPTAVVVGLIYVPLLLATISGTRMSGDEFFALLAGTLVAEFVLAFVMVCIHTLLMFSFPLIVDRGLGGWESIKVSAGAVWHNLPGVTGLWAVSFVAALAGYLALCVGIYFVIPLIVAGNLAAYRKVFPGVPDPVSDPS